MMNLKSILWFVGGTVGIVILVVALLWQFGAQSGKPITDISGNKIHTFGTGNVEVVEFSDFQCPACGAVQIPLKQLLTKYESKITFVYRHFPLSTIHPYAMIAAQASEAAGKQGKFWEMHDLLFARQSNWSQSEPSEVFKQYAKELLLDEIKFAVDFGSQETKDVVAADSLAATRYRISATPTFYVNGIETTFEKIEGKILELTK
ncbi:MAG: DsbA family protein [bacterium]